MPKIILNFFFFFLEITKGDHTLLRTFYFIKISYVLTELWMIFCLVWHFAAKTGHFRLKVIFSTSVCFFLEWPNTENIYKRHFLYSAVCILCYSNPSPQSRMHKAFNRICCYLEGFSLRIDLKFSNGPLLVKAKQIFQGLGRS